MKVGGESVLGSANSRDSKVNGASPERPSDGPAHWCQRMTSYGLTALRPLQHFARERLKEKPTQA